MREINRIVVHCAATPPDMDIGAAEIREWHLDRGWNDIGYHAVIRRDGGVELGRPVEVMGAHAAGYNDDSIAVCLVGGVDEDGEADSNYTRHQWSALERIVGQWMAEYPNAEVCGHRDLPGVTKACPSFDAPQWWYGE